MGFLDVLKPKSPLEKAAKMVREPFAQPDVRRGAMNKLLEIGTEEAYTALLQRFTINAHGQIADEAEKRELVEDLARVGEPVLPALERFIRTEKTIAFPIRALTKIRGQEAALAFLIDTLQKYEPLDHRSTQAKTTLIFSVAEMAGPEHAQVLVPYLGDHHDDVQFQAIGALERLANPETREPLAKVCCGEGHAPRIQRRAAQALVDLGWPVKDLYDQFFAELKGEYLLGKKGQLLKKGAAE